MYSAVVLLVSIKFRFILGYSSVWYETQRQDTVSVGKPIKKEREKNSTTLKLKNKLNLQRKQSHKNPFVWRITFLESILIHLV